MCILLLWAIAADIVGKPLVFPSPRDVLIASGNIYSRPEFLSAVGATSLRVLAAFVLCLVAGSVTGAAAGRFPLVDALLAPVVTLSRATPVLAIILLVILWFPSTVVPVISAFLMGYPVMHTGALYGFRAVDSSLIEMASLFRVPRIRVLVDLRVRAALPHILAGASNTLGMCWKVVVAGEVLSQPVHALGTGMQESRIYLETSGVFVWAIASIALCGASEYILGLLAKKAKRHGV